MIRIKYSIVCDYCNKVFCDSLDGHYFDNNELPLKFQEAKNKGWGISPGGDYSAHVLCNDCVSKGISYIDICDKLEQERLKIFEGLRNE